jgi:hypothetical protein
VGATGPDAEEPPPTVFDAETTSAEEPLSTVFDTETTGSEQPPPRGTTIVHHHYHPTTILRLERGAAIGAGASLAINSAITPGAGAGSPPPGRARPSSPPEDVLPATSPVALGLKALQEAIDLLSETLPAEYTAMRSGAATRLFFELMAALHRGQAGYRSGRPTS